MALIRTVRLEARNADEGTGRIPASQKQHTHVVVGVAVTSTDLTPSDKSSHAASRFQMICWASCCPKLVCPLETRQERQFSVVVKSVQIGEHDSEEPWEEHKLTSISLLHR